MRVRASPHHRRARARRGVRATPGGALKNPLAIAAGIAAAALLFVLLLISASVACIRARSANLKKGFLDDDDIELHATLDDRH